MSQPAPGHGGRWPKVSVVIGGRRGAPAGRHTAASVDASDYEGEIQVLIGAADEAGTAAEIINSHAAESAGPLLMILHPGSTLDPRCLRRLVVRMQADETLAAVAPQWRAPDGGLLAPNGYLSADRPLCPFLQGGRNPASVISSPNAIDLDATGSMLVRTRDFFAVGGLDLRLDGTPYLGADFGRRLAQLGGGIEVETRAVGFAPSRPAGPYRLPGYALVTEPTGHSPDRRPTPTRILWAAAHLPDRDRSGVDARHLEMLEALVQTGAEVLVWAEHDSGNRTVTGYLESIGTRWIAPPPDRRWNVGPAAAAGRWLRDLLAGGHWDMVLIAEPRLTGWVVPQARAVAPLTRLVVDLGTVRFPKAHGPKGSPDREIEDDSIAIGDTDGVIAATGPDASVVSASHPELPTHVFPALGRGPRSSPVPGREPGLLFVGDLLHRPNLEALEWWIEVVAARVEAQAGHPAPLRLVGHGSEAHRSAWRQPGKTEIAGWMPAIEAELAAARALVVPLTYVTGTGGRIVSALRSGLPVVASGPAAAVLPPALADLVLVGNSADELAGHIGRLLTDAAYRGEVRAQISAADVGSMVERRREQLHDWLAAIDPRPIEDPVEAIRTPGSRREPPRRSRAS